MEVTNENNKETLRNSMTITLPSDIITTILEHFTNDCTRSGRLVRLMFVCREFRTILEPYLYKSLLFEDHPKSIRTSKLNRTLDHRIDLAPYIKKLGLWITGVDDVLENEHYRLMSRCTSVETFLLKGINLYDSEKLEVLMENMNPKSFSVQGGPFTRGKSNKVIGDIFYLIRHCTELRHLTIGPAILYIDPTESVGQGIELPLESLSTSKACWTTNSLKFLHGVDLPKLKKFQGATVNEGNAREVLAQCLEKWNPTLTDLDLQMSGRYNYNGSSTHYKRYNEAIASLSELRTLNTSTEFLRPQTLLGMPSLEHVYYEHASLSDLEELVAALRTTCRRATDECSGYALPALRSFTIKDYKYKWGVAATLTSLKAVLEERGVEFKACHRWYDLDSEDDEDFGELPAWMC